MWGAREPSCVDTALASSRNGGFCPCKMASLLPVMLMSGSRTLPSYMREHADGHRWPGSLTCTSPGKSGMYDQRRCNFQYVNFGVANSDLLPR